MTQLASGESCSLPSWERWKSQNGSADSLVQISGTGRRCGDGASMLEQRILKIAFSSKKSAVGWEKVDEAVISLTGDSLSEVWTSTFTETIGICLREKRAAIKEMDCCDKDLIPPFIIIRSYVIWSELLLEYLWINLRRITNATTSRKTQKCFQTRIQIA